MIDNNLEYKELMIKKKIDYLHSWTRETGKRNLFEISYSSNLIGIIAEIFNLSKTICKLRMELNPTLAANRKMKESSINYF